MNDVGAEALIIFGTYLQVPVEAAYLYDAVMIYAKALRDVLDKGQDPRNGSAIFENIKNRPYRSIQGYHVSPTY